MKTTPLILLVLRLGLAAVVAQPIITNQPAFQTNIVGATVTFSVGATGAMPLSYQWRSHANQSSYTNIPFGTEATLVLTNVQPSSRRFAVVVTDAGGLTATSSPLAQLSVVTPPSITPANPTASLFADVTLFATNGSAAPLSYQWLLNGQLIAGAVTNTFVVTNVQKTNAGDYALVVTYAFGSGTSQVATLTITPFNSMYCFGFSWTDTRGIGCAWNPPSYYMSRACNGPMWPEFLSTNLGLPYVEANNYAHCGATAVDVLNQVAGFPAPPNPQLSLYCLWTGDSDFLRAFPSRSDYLNVTNEVAWKQLIQTLIANNSNAVDRLYNKGARAIIAQNQGDYRGLPGAVLAFGTNSVGLSKLSEYIEDFNAGFSDAMDTYSQSRPDLRIFSIDAFSKLNDVLVNPAQYGFTKTTVDALGDPSLLNQSFTGPGADYVYWDRLHGTSKLNKLIARWSLEALTDSIPEKLEAQLTNGGVTITMSRLRIGRDYTLQTSRDLGSWQEVQSFTASLGTNRVSQARSDKAASIYYRLQWQP